MLRNAWRTLGIPIQPYNLQVVKTAHNTDSCVLTFANILLPHELWAALAKDRHRHEEVFGTPSDWREYWHRVRNETWMRHHPCRDTILANPDLAGPLLLHGDDAPIDKHGKRSVRLLQFSSPVSSASTLTRKLIIAMWDPKPALAGHHEQAINAVAAWSFRVLASNAYPSVDHEGKLLDKKRLRLHGQPLCSWGAMGFFLQGVLATGSGWSRHSTSSKIIWPTRSVISAMLRKLSLTCAWQARMMLLLAFVTSGPWPSIEPSKLILECL